MNRFDELKESFCETTVKFVHTELDLAITFCEVAQSTHDPQRYHKNLEHAQKAYLSAKQFLRGPLSAFGTTDELTAKMRRAKSLIERVRNRSIASP